MIWQLTREKSSQSRRIHSATLRDEKSRGPRKVVRLYGVEYRRFVLFPGGSR